LLLKNWKAKARLLRNEVIVLYYSARDPRAPWYAKALVLLIVAYILSPVDIIPDFIPVLGYLDDLILVPAGIYLALRMIPREVIEEYRTVVAGKKISGRTGWMAAGIIVLIWLAVAYWIYHVTSPDRGT
jgi:uncharacterized membrane protein YkvA (DUF1232 family)